MNTLTYKDYIGSVNFSEKDNVFFGKVEGINALVNFEGESVSELRKAFWKRAEDGTRTRDPNLGKVMLYQLSYFRIVFVCVCKGRRNFCICKHLTKKISLEDDFFNTGLIICSPAE